jgi:hypothetical protein
MPPRPHPIRKVASQAALRLQRIEVARLHLESRHWPRLTMLLLVGLTGGFGLLSSFMLLQLGLETMALRYPIAVALAYGFFLLLLWLWLRQWMELWMDVVGAPQPFPSSTTGSAGSSGSTSAEAGSISSGGGGDFAGGGASASFDGQALDVPAAGPGPARVVRDVASAASDADELTAPFLVVVMVVVLVVAAVGAFALAVAVSSAALISMAPVLLAELMVDGALSWALYRHLRGQEPHHWLSTAISHTATVFAIAALGLAVVGLGLGWLAPGASSVGEVVQMLRAS